MCLRTVDEETKLTEGERGYKVLRRRKGHLTGVYHGSNNRYTLGKECIAPKGERSLLPHYPLGFHVFLKRADAIVWCRIHQGDGVWRVRLSNVLASGGDSCNLFPTIVAERMTILRKVAGVR